jgi:hypothetical protein
MQTERGLGAPSPGPRSTPLAGNLRAVASAQEFTGHGSPGESASLRGRCPSRGRERILPRLSFFHHGAAFSVMLPPKRCHLKKPYSHGGRKIGSQILEEANLEFRPVPSAGWRRIGCTRPFARCSWVGLLHPIRLGQAAGFETTRVQSERHKPAALSLSDLRQPARHRRYVPATCSTKDDPCLTTGS